MNFVRTADTTDTTDTTIWKPGLRNSENVMAFFVCVVDERMNAANSFESLLVC